MGQLFKWEWKVGPLKASSRIATRRGGRAKRGPRDAFLYPYQVSFRIPGRRGGRAKRGPRGAFLYPFQISSFLFRGRCRYNFNTSALHFLNPDLSSWWWDPVLWERLRANQDVSSSLFYSVRWDSASICVHLGRWILYSTTFSGNLEGYFRAFLRLFRGYLGGFLAGLYMVLEGKTITM